MMKDLFARLDPRRSSIPQQVDGAELDRRLTGLAEASDIAAGRLPGPPVDEARQVASRARTRRGLSDRLTPSPLELQPASGHCAGMWAGYARCLVQPPDDLDPWVRERLPALAERADVSLAVLDGDTLTHFDLRADNLLLRRGDAPPADRVVVIDWPWAMAGARWADATTMTLELAAQGDPESIRATDDVLERIAAHCGVTTEPLVDTTVGLAGFFTWQCRTPDPPGLPTLRAFQRSLAEGLTAWLKGTRLATW